MCGRTLLALPRRDEVRAGVVGHAAAGALDGVRPRHVPPDRGRRDAYRKLLVGASAVQVYSVLVYEGPGLASRIRKKLVDLLAESGYWSVATAAIIIRGNKTRMLRVVPQVN